MDMTLHIFNKKEKDDSQTYFQQALEEMKHEHLMVDDYYTSYGFSFDNAYQFLEFEAGEKELHMGFTKNKEKVAVVVQFRYQYDVEEREWKYVHSTVRAGDKIDDELKPLTKERYPTEFENLERDVMEMVHHTLSILQRERFEIENVETTPTGEACNHEEFEKEFVKFANRLFVYEE